MRILITGATGFIGSAIAQALRARGHTIVAGMHHADEQGIAIDYMQDVHEDVWIPRLKNIDVVINAVGILRETRHASFERMHHLAPAALFRACEQADVRRVIQISALGADAEATSQYHLSKKAADDALRKSSLDWRIVQPSLVFGMDGASTALFLQLASLPILALPGKGDQRMQPIHVDDLAALIVQLVEQPQGEQQTIAAVGPEEVTLRELLLAYRHGMGLGKPLCIPIPLLLVEFGARLGDRLRAGALSTETLDMLLRGNTADAAPITQLLGHKPRPVSTFFSPRIGRLLHKQAVLQWLQPLWLLSLSLLWIGTGIVSWLFAEAYGLHLLQAIGLTPELARIAFTAACGLNIALGLACLRPRRWLWLLQISVIVFYSIALTCVAPQLWVEPFGPLLKNIPILAMLLGLLTLQRRA